MSRRSRFAGCLASLCLAALVSASAASAQPKKIQSTQKPKMESIEKPIQKREIQSIQKKPSQLSMHELLWKKRWIVSEAQPEISAGGRVNTIAVAPGNDKLILVASETGGLFRSTDGVTWKHVDGLPASFPDGVAILAADPNVAIATVAWDLKANSGGGVWRSTNGGVSWTQPATGAVPPTPEDPERRLGGHDISIDPTTGRIYVGTDFGIAYSDDRGATWTHKRVFTSGDYRGIFSVVALGGNRVIAGGPSGVRISTNGSTWTATTTAVGSVGGIHSLTRSPTFDTQAYLVNNKDELYVTTDSGATWTLIPGTTWGGYGAGGIAFVKAMVGSGANPPLVLYFGNRLDVYRLTCSPAVNGYKYTGTWEKLNIDHADTRDLAFTNTHAPYLLGTDGGLHATANGGADWKLTGGGHAGYNALQLTEVKGQWIDDLGRLHLYIGTQDNNVLANVDGTWSRSVCCEGFFIELMRRVATSGESVATFTACAACTNLRSGAGLADVQGWSNPPGSVVGFPTMVRKTMHVQAVDASGGFQKGLAATYDLGESWYQYGALPEGYRDLPKVVPTSGGTLMYQAIKTGYDSVRKFDIFTLARIARPSGASSVTVTYPAMQGFGGLGTNPTMFAWYMVFAVDPGNGQHLIAPDVVNEKVMESKDGGETWTAMARFTNLVTDGGKYQFRRSFASTLSAISFSPDDPNMVMAGAVEGGLYTSRDRGATWTHLPGSERVAPVTSIYWRGANDALVSTYGRGLWRVRYDRLIQIKPGLEKLKCGHKCLLQTACGPNCLLEAIKPEIDLDPVTQEVLLVSGGYVTSARVEQGVLKEVTVSPGSTHSWVTEGEQAPPVEVHEAAGSKGWVGMEAPKPPREGLVARGVILDKVGAPVGFAYDAASAAVPPKPFRVLPAIGGRTKSVAASKPLIQMVSPTQAERFNAIEPGKTFQIRGMRLSPQAKDLVVDVDGRPSPQKPELKADGTFELEVTAPPTLGHHRVELRSGGKVIDGFVFIVKPSDEPRDPQELAKRKQPPRTGKLQTGPLPQDPN